MTRSPRDINVLITGFSVFPGAPVNPTAWAIERIQQEKWQPGGARLTVRTLPVRFGLWEREMEPLLEQIHPDVVIAFGLSAKATGVTLESTAHNVVATDRPDFTGACATGACVVENGRERYATGLPLREIEMALMAAGIPVSASESAGDYLCNLTFYRLMTLAAKGGPAIAGFIHVPYLDTQVAKLAASGHHVPHASTLTERQMMDAVKITAETCVAAVQRTLRIVA